MPGNDESGRTGRSASPRDDFSPPTYRPNTASSRRRGAVVGLPARPPEGSPWLATRILMEVASVFASSGREQRPSARGETRWSARRGTPGNRRPPPLTPSRRNGFREKPLLEAALRHSSNKAASGAKWPPRGLSPTKRGHSSPPGKHGRRRTVERKGSEFTAAKNIDNGSHVPVAVQTLRGSACACHALVTEDELCA